MDYRKTAAYKKIQANKGYIHLCGNCKFTTSCERMDIQSSRNIARKEKAMPKLSFVKKYDIEEFVEGIGKQGIGFINVYECSRFEFEYLDSRGE